MVNKKLIFIFTLTFLAQSYLYPKEVSLSLEEISKLALENNLDIQIAKFDTYIARNNLLETTSIFDTFFSANLSYNQDKKDTASSLLGTKNLTNNYSLQITKKIPLGTELEISAYNQRNWSNSLFFSLNPHTEAGVSLSIKQSLAKNFFGLKDKANIKITKLDIENSEFSSLENIELSLAEIQKAYWELVLRYEELKIKQDMLEQARRLYEIYREKMKIGLAEEPDLLAAQANLALRENDVLEAKLLLRQAKNNLLYLLNITDKDIEIIPKDKLDVLPEEFDLYSELKKAVESRRDYKIVKNQVEIRDIDLAIKKNSLWPEIDLEASFTKNGISSHYKSSWSEVSNQDNSQVYIGLKISFPWEKRKEKAQYNKAKLEKAKTLILLKRLERLIFRQINNDVLKVNTLSEQVKTFKEVLKIEKEKLKKEEEKLNYGRSSSDIIIRFQEDVLNSSLMLANSLYAYKISLIDLEQDKDTLLSKYWGGVYEEIS
ncbi:MAG TPA: TolC family protein [Candidatus Omnitrophica bacterium]|nr:MAG: hypothetical protein DRP80_06380 [Candidatus Omnitrophota bacterium]HEC68719.1 TolC family protein [Candidatus Omnitrophota bacterium]